MRNCKFSGPPERCAKRQWRLVSARPVLRAGGTRSAPTGTAVESGSGEGACRRQAEGSKGHLAPLKGGAGPCAARVWGVQEPIPYG